MLIINMTLQTRDTGVSSSHVFHPDIHVHNM